MFRTLLVANRGEIACRVIRTARRMGLVTVATHSEADADAPHVRQAHRAVCIGAAPATESYLNIEALLAAAAKTDADAIHPGYGFLSENADFAAACEDAGRIFVGPSPEAIRAMGSKIEAKNRVAAAGTPVVPGYQGADQSPATLRAEAARIGFPLLVKASAGGGGKGMRLVEMEDELEAAVAAAQREAASAFGDDAVLLERYLTAPKHIEVQLLADRHGNTLHLFERDCSVQRRHQKVIEEAPGPTVTDELRGAMGDAAIRAARAIDYRGAGTVEFIAEGDEFHFMEMNTRLQVEHPVTEMVVRVCQDGSEAPLDLVEWQLRIAAGEALPFAQEELAIRGHAVEARVYAENPKRRFLPSSGRLARVAFAGGDGVRVDAGVETGSDVPVHYDPMLAKVIAHGGDRMQAIERLGQALEGSELVGVEHNIAYLRRVLAHSDFRGGDYTTRLAEVHAAGLTPSPSSFAPVIAAIARLAVGDGDPIRGQRIRGQRKTRSASTFRANSPSPCGKGEIGSASRCVLPPPVPWRQRSAPPKATPKPGCSMPSVSRTTLSRRASSTRTARPKGSPPASCGAARTSSSRIPATPSGSPSEARTLAPLVRWATPLAASSPRCRGRSHRYPSRQATA